MIPMPTRPEAVALLARFYRREFAANLRPELLSRVEAMLLSRMMNDLTLKLASKVVARDGPAVVFGIHAWSAR